MARTGLKVGDHENFIARAECRASTARQVGVCGVNNTEFVYVRQD